MIGLIKGNIEAVAERTIVVMTTAGVGYLVNIGTNDYVKGDSVVLHIYTAVRQDEISLWGFRELQELAFFKKLLTVSGVGHKSALLLLSTLGVGNLRAAILSEDASALKVPGLGAKTSEKIIVDLKDKLSDIVVSDTSSETRSERSIVPDATQALLSLGYKQGDIQKAMNLIKAHDYTDLQLLIKDALRHI